MVMIALLQRVVYVARPCAFVNALDLSQHTVKLNTAGSISYSFHLFQMWIFMAALQRRPERVLFVFFALRCAAIILLASWSRQSFFPQSEWSTALGRADTAGLRALLSISLLDHEW